MYRIEATTNVDRVTLTEYPAAKDHIINELLIKFAKEMFKNKSFELLESEIRPGEHKVGIRGYIFKMAELEEMVSLIKLIEPSQSEPNSYFINRLKEIIVNQTVGV